MKNIIIACDGTWNQPFVDGAFPSNVQIISEILHTSDNALDEFNGAISPSAIYYNSGIGTGAGSLRYGAISSIEDGYFATTLPEHIKNAYKFLVDNYEPGDKIYFFGFSRGAFTARSLGSLIWYCGILKKDGYAEKDGNKEYYTDKVITKVYDLYQAKVLTKGKPATLAEIPDTQTYRNVEINYLGVFDTVPGLSPNDLKLHDINLYPHIKKARHALANDEHRPGFACALWQKKEGVDSIQRIFKGDHADIGGGWEYNRLVTLYKPKSPSDGDIHPKDLFVFAEHDRKKGWQIYGKYFNIADKKIKKEELNVAKIAALLGVNNEEANNLLEEWKSYLTSDKPLPTPLTDKAFFFYRLSNIALKWILKESGLNYFNSDRFPDPPKPPFYEPERLHSALSYDDMKGTWTSYVLWKIYSWQGSVDRHFSAGDIQYADGVTPRPIMSEQDYFISTSNEKEILIKNLDKNKNLLVSATLIDSFNHLIDEYNHDFAALGLNAPNLSIEASQILLSSPPLKKIVHTIYAYADKVVENWYVLTRELNKPTIQGDNLVKAQRLRLALASLKPMIEIHNYNKLLHTQQQLQNSQRSKHTASSGSRHTQLKTPAPIPIKTIDLTSIEKSPAKTPADMRLKQVLSSS